MAGTLKNMVAVGAGFIDGLGYGQNTKAAILREGLAEMRELSKEMYPTVRDDTFMESCGVADLIATSYGGRNRKVAAAWASARAKVSSSSTF
jgi:glycerol-3-phosphate dehydrogenase (NAD+)